MINHSLIARVKTLLLIGVFSSIIITAHPTPVTYPMVDTAWPILHSLGIDVFMKPFTSDMVFMYDSDLKKSLYKDDFYIIYKSTAGDKNIEVTDLSFHRFRVPFTWLGIAARESQDTSPYIYTLCTELKRSHGPGVGFTISSKTDKDIAHKYKMNQFIPCKADDGN